MQLLLTAVLLATSGMAGCATPRAGSTSSTVDAQVRAFVLTVAADVTRDGPAAWRKHFSAGPNFFMAVNGRLVFSSSAVALAATDSFARTMKSVTLRWGDDLRVDALSDTLAVVAVSYHEVRTSNSGERVEEDGFFTATAEREEGRWVFRNAHWSLATP
jgi:hypothetical protein